MNVKRLKQVLEVIKEEPQRLRMSTWFVNQNDIGHTVLADGTRLADGKFTFNSSSSRWDDEEQKIPPCGTVGCFAGWAVFTFDGEKKARKQIDFEKRAMELLELDRADAIELFYVDKWKSDNAFTYRTATTQEQRFAALANQVEYLITKYTE